MNVLRLKDHLEKLYPFKVIADVEGMTAAAKVLGLSQSSLSHTIKILEDILEVKLLRRHPKGISLSPEGELLYEFSKKIFHQTDNVELQIKSIHGKDSGLLKVSTHEVLAGRVWPKFIQKMGQSYPELQISLLSGRVDAIIEDVLKGNVDLALTVEPLNHAKLTKIPLYSSELGFFVAYDAQNLKNLPVLKKATVGMKDLDGIPVLTDTHAHIRQGTPIPQYLSMAGLKLSSSYTLNSFEAAMNLCAVGVGVAVVPKMVAQEAIKTKKLRELKVQGLGSRPFGKSVIHMSYLKQTENRMVSIFAHEMNHFIENDL